VSQKIISFSEFMEMRYCDFKKIEATYYFMQKIKNGNTKADKKVKKDDLKQKLNNLDTVKASDLNLPEEYMEIFK